MDNDFVPTCRGQCPAMQFRAVCEYVFTTDPQNIVANQTTVRPYACANHSERGGSAVELNRFSERIRSECRILQARFGRVFGQSWADLIEIIDIPVL
jgi:hypothetical protein